MGFLKEVSLVANRNYYQFSYSWERMPVSLMGSAAQTDVGAFATLVNQGITYTAKTMGAAGNNITIALTAGGTAGAEVVTVSGNAISVSIQSGVSTQTQIKTALDASAPAQLLIGESVASGGTAVNAVAATPLAGGDDSDFTVVGLQSATLSQIGTGLFRIQLQNAFKALLSASIMIQRASGAVDLVAQLAAVDVSSLQQVDFRMNAAATPTNLANGDVLYIRLDLRNSSQPN